MKTVPTPMQIVARLLHARGGAPRGWAIDVGAHVGGFSRDLAQTGLFAGVLAFEPNPANFAALEDLAASDPRIRPVRSAVGARAGEAALHCDADTATGSLLPYRPGYANRGAVTRMAVPVVTLDAARREPPLAGQPVSLLKIDTQGQDLAVLEGARELLAAERPVLIVELIHVPLYSGQATPQAIERYAGDLGYTLHALFHIHATAEGRLAFADAIFAPRELPLVDSQDYIQLDNAASYEEQLGILQRICQERLDVINVLDAEVKRLAAAGAAR